MCCPLYFFSATRRDEVVDGDVLRSTFLAVHQLDQVLDGVRSVSEGCFCQELTAKGPGGASGVLLAVFPPDGQAPKRLGYFPEFQDWQPARDKLWIGLDNEEPPRPRDLVRPGGGRDVDGAPTARHAGYKLALGDGATWTVPVIRRPPALEALGCKPTDLPVDMGWDCEGRFVETIKPLYRQIWDDTSELCALFFEDGGAVRDDGWEFTVETGLKWAIRALALNYRLGRHEQNRLKLIDSTNVIAILGATVDYLLVKQMLGREKKTAGP